jgi:hypothetical protein
VRFLVYFLLLANLAYFGWYQYSPRQKPAEIMPVLVPPGINQLVLLSERAVAESPAEPREVEVVKGPLESVEQLAVVAGQMDTKEVIEQTKGSDAVTLEPEVEPEPASAAPEPVCHTVGPLTDTGDVTKISQKLSRYGFQPDVRGGKVREPAGYWVYMRAMPAAKARSIVADLDSQGMKDYFIGRKNHISLGIFSTEKKARKRLKRVKELGYDAELGQRYRNRAVYWLDVEAGESPLPGSPIWEEIQSQHTELRVEQVSCDSLDH